jgi:hypothetical protein
MIAGCAALILANTSVSARRNGSSPDPEKISEIDFPNRADTISSVSKRWSPVRRSRHRPTEDFPAPIIPMSTMERGAVIAQYQIERWKLQIPNSKESPISNPNSTVASMLVFGYWVWCFRIAVGIWRLDKPG